MAFSRKVYPAHSFSSIPRDFDFFGSDGDWPDDAPRARDWKKMVLVLGLGTLSWGATYIGMLELIESNMGDLPLVHKAVIGFSVAMLMTMIIWLLDQIFAPIPTATKVAYVGGYLFLTLISVGFGFGFYWKVLESRSESTRSAESAVTQVQASLHAAATRMVQLSATLDQLNEISKEKADLERTKGTSCPNSRPGDGPRRKLRDDDAQRFAFAADFVRARVDGVKNDLSALDGELAKVVSGDKSTVDAESGTRNDFMRTLGRKLDITVAGFNAFRTDPQLKQLRFDLAERADKTVFPDGRGRTFTCPDPQLQQALKGVVRAIDQLPALEKPKIAAVEGSEATIEAFRRLTATFYGALSFKLPPSADELRDMQKKAVQSVEASPAVAKALSDEPVAGLSKRDHIPLAIAVFVDLCLLLVSMGRPINWLHGLVPKMRAAERGPIIQILSRFNEIHRDDEIRQNFEVFRHVVFDFHGAYYVAVPLNAPYKPNGSYTRSTSTGEIADLVLEAHLLANLFTSFEKEKIFYRVYSPLLTTRAIKKKLQRQGSKFANAEAFRVYRFRDGAWPEIILGAVMGAARRVEAEKKKRRLEQHFTSHKLVLPVANDVTQPGEATATRMEETLRANDIAQASDHAGPSAMPQVAAASGGRGGGFFARRAAARQTMAAHENSGLGRSGVGGPADLTSTDTTAVSAPEIVAEFGPYAARASREIDEERYRAALPTLRGEDGVLERPRPRGGGSTCAKARTDGEGAGDLPAGEVILFAIPGDAAKPDQDRDTKCAAGHTTMPAGVLADTARIAPPTANLPPVAQAPVTHHYAAKRTLTSGQPERRIGVVLCRETAEFALPVTEATLPGALLASHRDSLTEARADAMTALPTPRSEVAGEVGEAAPNAAAEARETVAAMEEIAPVGAENVDEDENEDDVPALFTEPDIEIRIDDISRRFRPAAAE